MSYGAAHSANGFIRCEGQLGGGGGVGDPGQEIGGLWWVEEEIKSLDWKISKQNKSWFILGRVNKWPRTEQEGKSSNSNSSWIMNWPVWIRRRIYLITEETREFLGQRSLATLFRSSDASETVSASGNLLDFFANPPPSDVIKNTCHQLSPGRAGRSVSGRAGNLFSGNSETRRPRNVSPDDDFQYSKGSPLAEKFTSLLLLLRRLDFCVPRRRPKQDQPEKVMS